MFPRFLLQGYMIQGYRGYRDHGEYRGYMIQVYRGYSEYGEYRGYIQELIRNALNDSEFS